MANKKTCTAHPRVQPVPAHPSKRKVAGAIEQPSTALGNRRQPSLRTHGRSLCQRIRQHSAALQPAPERSSRDGQRQGRRSRRHGEHLGEGCRDVEQLLTPGAWRARVFIPDKPTRNTSPPCKPPRHRCTYSTCTDKTARVVDITTTHCPTLHTHNTPSTHTHTDATQCTPHFARPHNTPTCTHTHTGAA